MILLILDLVTTNRLPVSHTHTCARRSGSVCLDVINQTWSPMFGALQFPTCGRSWCLWAVHKTVRWKLRVEIASADLVNVFEVFLPQLLLYPNPTDPLNGEAAALLMREPESYNEKVRGTSPNHRTTPASQTNTLT